MNQEERRLYLIRALQREMPQYGKVRIPESGEGQWRLLRSLFNVRPPYPASPEFLDIQDEYLGEMIRERGITDGDSLPPAASSAAGSPATPALTISYTPSPGCSCG